MVFYTFSLHKGCPRKLHLAQSEDETQQQPFVVFKKCWVSLHSTQPTWLPGRRGNRKTLRLCAGCQGKRKVAKGVSALRLREVPQKNIPRLGIYQYQLLSLGKGILRLPQRERPKPWYHPAKPR